MARALSSTLRIPAAALVLGTALATVGLVAAPHAAHAATLTVSTTADVVDAGIGCVNVTKASLPGPDGVTSLREAVCAANKDLAADSIVLAAGSYVLGTYLEIYTSMAFSGAGIDGTTISVTGANRVIDAFSFSGPTTLEFSDLTLRGSGVSGPGASEGGVLSLFDMTTHLERTRVSGGVAEKGGGIANFYGTLTILNSEVSGNEADAVTGASLGGGIWSIGDLRMQGSTVSGNTATGGSGGGIALELGGAGAATIEQSTISGNRAATDAGVVGFGGGIAVTQMHHGMLTISASTISDNSAGEDGGAVHLDGDSASDFLLGNSTVTANSATGTGGIARVDGFATVNGSILAGNTGFAPDTWGTIAGSNNLIGVAGSGFVNGVGGNLVGSGAAPISAMLGSLADNGGPTFTRLPLADSPALDALGSGYCGAVDQRGVPRPQGGACDIGAVELSTTTTTMSSGPAAVTTSRAATFAVAGTSSVSPVTFECALNGAAFAVCASPVSLTGLADGSHTMRIRAVDSFGGTDATPAAHTWTVDATGPTTTWGAVTLGTVAGTPSTLAFTAADALSAVASVECSLNGAAFAACTSPVTLNALSVGPQSFRVQSTDALGNVGPVVEHTWSVSAVPPAGTSGLGVDELTATGGDAVPGAVVASVLLGLGVLLLVLRRRMLSA